MSTSNVLKCKIPRFAGKQFESTKIDDEVETSANRKGNDKQLEVGDVSKKVCQSNPNSKSRPLTRRQKPKILGPEPNKGKN